MPNVVPFTPGGGGGIPGANPTGSNAPVSAAGSSTPAIGSNSNPFVPQYPSSTGMPPLNFPMFSGASGTGINLSPDVGSPNWVSGSMGFGGTETPSINDFIKGMHKAGFSASQASMLYNFLASGAGFNPEILQNLFSSIQGAQAPMYQRQMADVLENFSQSGNRYGSSAAIGMGDFEANFAAAQQQTFAQLASSMYEQAVQNYMQVLMGGKGNPPPSTFQNILAALSVGSQDAQAILTGLNSGKH